MRRWSLVVMMLALAACGDEAQDQPIRDVPVYKECASPSIQIMTMEELEDLGASGCDSAFNLTLWGPGIETLEPLRGLRQVSSLTVYGTNIKTLEPLRDLQDVVTDVTFEENSKLSYCELTGWIADMKKRDPNKNFGVTIDNPSQQEPCPRVDYPERGEQ